MKQISAGRVPAAVVVIAGLAIVVVVMVVMTRRESPPPATVLVELPRRSPAAAPPAPPPTPAPTAAPSPDPEGRLPAIEANLILPHEDEAPQAPESNFVNGMDPEDQPRTTFVLDFAEAAAAGRLPDGYTAEGVVLTERGIALPPATDPDNPRREGVLTSPNLPAEFPGNSFAPLWRQEVPEGTAVEVELALSPDGREWGPWTPVIASGENEIEPVMPDGSPNPFFGYTAGPLYSWGSDQWNHFRFRVRLSSGTVASPAVAGMRIFYQDSTMGTGHVGRLEELQNVLPPGANAAP